MQVFDLHHMTKAAKAFASQAIASDTTTEGEIIDMKGFTSIEFILLTKTVTDGDYEAVIYESDDSAMADEAIATEIFGAVDFADDTDDGAVGRMGYYGKKRYVQLKIVSTNTTTGVDIISAVALQGSAHHQPVANQNG